MKQGWAPFVDCTYDYRLAVKRCGSKLIPGFQRAFKNPVYIVQEFLKPSEWGPITLLMVRRSDEGPIRSWSHMQRIKNEIVGKDRVAVEVYSAERDLVDQANMYHLWVLPEGFELPFGLHRKV